MKNETDILQELMEAKAAKKRRLKAFDEVSCEDALKLVEKRKKKPKYESIEVKEAKALRSTQATEKNFASLSRLLKGVSNNDLNELMDTLAEDEKLERELNVSMLDVMDTFKKAGVR